MKKGFTLIELLAVIVLLGILGVVIIPKIGDSIKNSENKAYIAQVESIKKGVNDFLIDNSDILSGNNTVTIKLGTVKQGGYLPMNIKNPITRKSFSNESRIIITSNGSKYDIQLDLFDLENYNESIDSNSPTIVLNGNYIEYVEVNSDYQDAGIIAYDSVGNQINTFSTQINGDENADVDTSQINKTYSIVYSVTDSNGYTSSATRTVIVKDSTAPTIVVPEDTTLHVSELAGFNPMNGVVVSDNYFDASDITTNVESSLSNRAGKYIITYSATDGSGNTSTVRRVIGVDGSFERYYTRVDYIESTGTQYIDTGVIANRNTGFDIDFISYNKISKISGEYGTLFGARKTYRDSGFQLTTYNNASLLGHFLFGTNSSYEDIRYSAGIVPSTRQKISFKNNILTLPDNSTTTVTDYTFTTPSTLAIFALNQDGSIIEYSKTKLYNFKIYDGDTLIRDFIPCYRNSDNEVGLYDLVDNKFYTNAGTGKFEYNKDFNDKYVKLNYIEFTGTQYIDTKYAPKSNTVIEIDYDATASAKWIFGSRTAVNNADSFGVFMNSDTQYWVRIGENTDNSDHKLNNINVLGRHKIYASSSNFIQDDSNRISFTQTNTIGTYSIYLGTMNNAGTSVDNRMFIGKIYSIKIWNNTTLVRNFIPAVRNSDNVAGLYDEVNDAFYTNNGTGEFIKGNY